MPTWRLSLPNPLPSGNEGVDIAIAVFGIGLPDKYFTSSVMRFSGAEETIVRYTGSGIAYGIAAGGDLDVLAGAITGIEVRVTGDVTIRATGLNFSARLFWDAALASDIEALATLILGGRDLMFGTSRNDDMAGFIGADTLRGLGGADSLNGGDQADRLFGGKGVDSIDGEDGNDRLYGGASGDSFEGGFGNDLMFGGAGNDILDGTFGADTVHGGLGEDTIIGTAGADRFVFDTKIGAGQVDFINGFDVDEDRILLDNDIFTATGPVGTLAAGRFREGTAAEDANDRIIYDSATGRLWYDADGQGGAGKVQFALLTPGLALNAGDFQVIG